MPSRYSKLHSRYRNLMLIVLFCAVAIFGLTYAFIQAKTPPSSRVAHEAPPLDSFSEVAKTSRGKFEEAISPESRPEAPSSQSVDHDKSIPELLSSDSRVAQATSSVEDLRHGSRRRLKAVARTMPEEATSGSTDKLVKDVTLSEELAAESFPSGNWDYKPSVIGIPEGCEYITHKIDLLERRPWKPVEVDWDWFTSYYPRIEENSKGDISSISLVIGARGKKQLPEGSLIKMRLSVDVHCENGYQGQIDALSE